MMEDGNPLEQDESGFWWFWDEIWFDRIGPFPTEDAAKYALDKYIEEYL